MATFFCTMFSQHLPAGTTVLPSGGVLYLSGQPHPLGNFAIGQKDSELEICCRKIKESNMPGAIFGLENREAAQPFVKSQGFSEEVAIPAMEVEIRSLPETPIPDGYQFVRLTKADSPSGFAQGLSDGYGVPLPICEAMSPKCIAISDDDDAEFQYFVVEKDGKVAAVSAMGLLDGVAGIYCVAVLPEYRNRGLGAAVTAEPLRRAAKVGYDIGVLQASTMGLPVYQRLGFVESGSVDTFFRFPEAN